MFKSVGKILKWTGAYKKRLYLGFVCSFFSAWCAAGPVITAAWALNQMVENYQHQTPIHPQLGWIALGLVTLFIFLRFLFTYGKNRLQESIGYEIGAQQRIAVGEKLKRVSLNYFAKNHIGDILAALTTELSTLELQSMKIIDTVINGYIQVLATTLCIGFFSPIVSLTGAVGVIVSALALHLISKQSAETAPLTHEAQEKLSGATLEYVRGLSVVKSFGQEGVSIARFKAANQENKKIRIRNEYGFVPLNCLHLFSLKTAGAFMMLVAAWQTYNGSLSLSYLLMIAFFSFTVFGGVESMNDAAHVLSVVDVVFDRLTELQDEAFIDEGGLEITPKHFDICFDEVSFGYDNREILHQLSFEIPENTTTAIVGPSGSGKSTICNLIARFYDANQGKITIGGDDIQTFSCDSLLENISMVFQNVYLFHDTIKNNIKFGKPDATDEDIITTAKAARCHDFIMSLPEGYETVIGEGGNTLSGGEKQRISIARSMLKDAPIIILDEATASIDPENEYEIQQAISALVKGKTLITIAHRISTIEKAHQILVIDQGNLVQQGNHETLMKQEGVYRQFVNIRQQAENWQIES